MFKDWKRYLLGIAALALGVISAPAVAHCDFFTGGGFIVRGSGDKDTGPKANFGVGGGCKHGQPWGHLQYVDHSNGLNVHWLTITGYNIFPEGDENDPKRTGLRQVCGTARTNMFPGEVHFVVGARDNGEPGGADLFALRLTADPGHAVILYTTECDADHSLGGSDPRGGGNIQLHKPNRSTSEFAPTCPVPVLTGCSPPTTAP